MSFPAFFELAPRIPVRDPLAALLGTAEDGRMDYGYADAVRLAGHSCPTVAGAYLTARAALRVLYPDQPAERGGIAVRMPAAEDHGTTGVTAQVLTLITGAAAANGFHGIAGRHARQGLLSYATTPGPAVHFSRCDDGAAVTVEFDLAPLPPPPGLRLLMVAALDPAAAPAQRQAFAEAWQERVRRLLLEHADDPRVLRVTRLS